MAFIIVISTGDFEIRSNVLSLSLSEEKGGNDLLGQVIFIIIIIIYLYYTI